MQLQDFLFSCKNKIKIYTNMNKVLLVSILIINLLRKVTTSKLKKFENRDVTCFRGLSQENILWNVLGQNNPTYWPKWNKMYVTSKRNYSICVSHQARYIWERLDGTLDYVQMIYFAHNHHSIQRNVISLLKRPSEFSKHKSSCVQKKKN